MLIKHHFDRCNFPSAARSIHGGSIVCCVCGSVLAAFFRSGALTPETDDVQNSETSDYQVPNAMKQSYCISWRVFAKLFLFDMYLSFVSVVLISDVVKNPHIYCNQTSRGWLHHQ